MKGFDNKLYLKLQKNEIKKRLKQFDKLYLEVGGKLFDDYHAKRVLPGFNEKNKINMLLDLKDELEIIIVCSSKLIENGKKRGEVGITYDLEVMRMIDNFKALGFKINSVVLTLFDNEKSAIKLSEILKEKGISTYFHYYTKGYPTDVKTIVSEEGYGKNPFIKTTRKIVVVTAPGPNSGKLGTCLSQLYHEKKNGSIAGYAKLETFPVWNLDLNHPINIAYEAATVDLGDKNMIDSYHLEKYNTLAINYNRDLELFPVLKEILKAIYEKDIYFSPTDMGINMVGFAIKDDLKVQKAAKEEIVRRYFKELVSHKKGSNNLNQINDLKMMMSRLDIDENFLKARGVALKTRKESQRHAACLIYKNKIFTGKDNKILKPTSSLLLNSLKIISKIPDEVDLISKILIDEVLKLKNKNNQIYQNLSLDDTLILLSVSAVTNPTAKVALDNIDKLKNTYLHSSYILSEEEKDALLNLGIFYSEEDMFYSDNLYY